jgi:hypothetical protein
VAEFRFPSWKLEKGFEFFVQAVFLRCSFLMPKHLSAVGDKVNKLKPHWLGAASTGRVWCGSSVTSLQMDVPDVCAAVLADI